MILKTFSSIAPGLGWLVKGMPFGSMILIAADVERASFLADCQIRNDLAELFCTCGTRSQGVPQSPANWEMKDNK